MKTKRELVEAIVQDVHNMDLDSAFELLENYEREYWICESNDSILNHYKVITGNEETMLP